MVSENNPATDDSASRKPHLLRRLYNWTISWADSKYGTVALLLIAFMESSFFPVPPDVLLIALCFGAPARWYIFSLWCTLGSVAGGMAGWAIGLFAWHILAPYFFRYVPGFTHEVFDIVQVKYQDNAMLAIIAAAFTPIPYKVFTIASGVFAVPLQTLVIGSLVGRGARFILVSGVIRVFGPSIRPLLEKYFEVAVTALFLLGLLGFLAIKFFLK